MTRRKQMDNSVIVAVVSGLCTMLGRAAGLPECRED